MTELPAAFAGLFDDAAVFPPGSAPFDLAVRDHLWRRRSAYGPAVGNLLVAAADADALLREAHAASAGGDELDAAPLCAGLVVPPGGLDDARAAAARLDPKVAVTTMELKTAATDESELAHAITAATDAARDFAVYLELGMRQVRDGALDRLAGSPVGLKFRTGGLEPGLFPSPAELAEVIHAAVRAGVRFKLTAGLHRAVRYTDPATGFRHHGFLNIAVATALGRAGADATAIETTLRSTDAAGLAAAFGGLDDSWRKSFVSFGTCSVTEPADTLIELGLLPIELLADEARRRADALAGQESAR